MYRFEKFRVYHEAMKLIEIIYLLSSKLPKDERFGLADQLKRSSTSIVLNIAEGTGGLGDKEFKSFLRNALKSFYETVAGLKIAEKLFALNIEKPLSQCEVVGRQLNALIKTIKNSS